MIPLKELATFFSIEVNISVLLFSLEEVSSNINSKGDDHFEIVLWRKKFCGGKSCSMSEQNLTYLFYHLWLMFM